MCLMVLKFSSSQNEALLKYDRSERYLIGVTILFVAEETTPLLPTTHPLSCLYMKDNN